MTMRREQFFVCSFTSEQHHRSAHLRAWTAGDAKRSFLDMLASDGIDEPGSVTVAPSSRLPVAPPELAMLEHASHP